MKRMFGYTFFVCIALIPFFGCNGRTDPNKVSKIEMVNADRTFEDINLDFSFNSDFKIRSGNGYDEIDLKETTFENAIGKPSIPNRQSLVNIPAHYDVDHVEITSLERDELQGKYNIKPIQPPVECCGRNSVDVSPRLIAHDSAIYNSDQLFPSKIIEIVSSGFMAGHRLAHLKIAAFQYIPKEGKVFFIKKIGVRVVLKKEFPFWAKSVSSKLFRPIIQNLVANPKELLIASYFTGQSLRTDKRYLIVTNQNLMSLFNRIAVFKDSKGLSTEILTVENITQNYPGRDVQEKIRNAIIDYQQNFGTEWVLLGGDEDVVPVRYCHNRSNYDPTKLDEIFICDAYYSNLDGSWDADEDSLFGEINYDNVDLLPDVFLGRIPLHDQVEINNFIDKLITYETNPGNGDSSYLLRVGYTAADQMRDFNTVGQHQIIADQFPSRFIHDLETMVEQPSGEDLNPTGPFGSDVVNTMSTGFGMLEIFNHGRPDGFITMESGVDQFPKSYIFTFPTGSHGDLNDLNNIDKYGIVNSVACDFGAFDLEKWFSPTEPERKSVSELFLSGERKGAVAVVAYSRYGYVSSSYLFVEKFFYNLFNIEGAKHIGTAHNLSKLSYLSQETQIYSLNLLGDPEMVIHTDMFPSYVCGDSNSDQNVGELDINFLIDYFFGSGQQPYPFKSGDSDADGKLGISDIFYLIDYVYLGQTPPCNPSADYVPKGNDQTTKQEILNYITAITSPPPSDIPASPFVEATITGENSISLKWDPVNYADYYIVYWGNDSRGANEYFVYPNSSGEIFATSYSISNLFTNMVYYFAVVAGNSSGKSPYSFEINLLMKDNVDQLNIEIPYDDNSDLHTDEPQQSVSGGCGAVLSNNASTDGKNLFVLILVLLSVVGIKRRSMNS